MVLLVGTMPEIVLTNFCVHGNSNKRYSTRVSLGINKYLADIKLSDAVFRTSLSFWRYFVREVLFTLNLLKENIFGTFVFQKGGVR